MNPFVPIRMQPIRWRPIDLWLGLLLLGCIGYLPSRSLKLDVGRFRSTSKVKNSILQWPCALHRVRLVYGRIEAMPSKQRSTKKYEESVCPKSSALVGRCNAGGPAQICLKYPTGLIGADVMNRLRIRDDDKLFRCAYCGIVYVSVGIPGMERIIGTWAAHGFVLDASHRKLG